MERSVVVLGLDHGISVVRNLAKRGYTVYGLTNNKNDLGLSSRFGQKSICPDPRDDLAAWTRFMIDFAKGKDRPVLIPTADLFVIALDKAGKELEPHYRHHGFGSGLRVALTSKHTQHKLADRHGFPSPSWRYLTRKQELEIFLRMNLPPFVIKPEFSYFWQEGKGYETLEGAKVMVCNSADEAMQVFKKVKPFTKGMVIEELIPGPDESLIYFAGFMHKGKLKGRIVGQKTRVIPIHYGSASFVELVDMKEVEDLCELFLRRMGYQGLCGIEIKIDSRDRKPKLIEINPRYSLWDDIAIKEGVNTAKEAVDALYGDDIMPVRPKHFKQKWFSLHRDIPAFMQYNRAGELSLWNWIKSITPPITMNDLPLSDPSFVMANAWNMGKGFIQKLGKS